MAAQKLGSRTAIICKLGDDSFGRDYKKHLDAVGVDTQSVEIVSGETTGIAQICVSNDTGDNHIVIVVGANDKLSPQDVDDNLKLVEVSKVLLCQLETPIPATLRALETFKGISILNAAPGLKDLPDGILRLPTIFCVNESEASLITGLPVDSVAEAKLALFKLQKMGCRTIIATMGENGAIFLKEDPPGVVKHVRIPKVDKVLDTTGAGDCFLGALAHALSKSGMNNLEEAIGRACLIASLSVQRLGTQSSFPSSEEIQSLSGYTVEEI